MSDISEDAAPPQAEAALAALAAAADPAAAEGLAARHRTATTALGVPAAQIAELCAEWRAAIEDALGKDEAALAARMSLAEGLWASGVFEARLAAARLVTQARIRGDGPVWAALLAWAAEADCAALADAVAGAAQRRLGQDPARLGDLAPWLEADALWLRRAALVWTLGLAKERNLSDAGLEMRETVLDWAARLSADPRQPIQQAAAAWLRTLSVRDPGRVQAFIEAHGAQMKPESRREALRRIQGGAEPKPL